MKHTFIVFCAFFVFSCSQVESVSYAPIPFSCPHPEIKLKPVTIGNFSFYVPETFLIHAQDSINLPGSGYFVTDKCAKMYFNSSTLGTSEILDETRYKEYKIAKDTTGGIIKLITYKTEPEPVMEIHVARSSPGLDLMGMEEYNVDYIFNAMTNMGSGNTSCLSKKELEVLLFSVINGTVSPVRKQ